jgi:hypothetical protein
MKLNVNDFKKSLEEKRLQKQKQDEGFLRMRLDLEASSDARNQYLAQLATIALDAALNGSQEVNFPEEGSSEYIGSLRRLGFDIGEREVGVSPLLQQLRGMPTHELFAMSERLQAGLSKLYSTMPPKETSALFKAYQACKKTGESKDIQVMNLLRAVSLYERHCHSNEALDLEVDARLWRQLSSLQDLVKLYAPSNDSENPGQTLSLIWADESFDVEDPPAPDTSYSMLNPVKLRYVNSEDADALFAKIKEEIADQTETLQSFFQFDFVSTAEQSHIVFRDGTRYRVPFAAQDLELIFVKMGFEVKVDEQGVQRHAQVSTFKVNFDLS